MQLLTHELNEFLDKLDEKINNTIDGVMVKEWDALRKMLIPIDGSTNTICKILQQISQKKKFWNFQVDQNDLQEF